MKHILLTIAIIAVQLVSYAQVQIPNTISKEDKVYGLSQLWNEANQNFVYLGEIDRIEWNKLYKNLITEVQETENDYEYYRLLQKFYAYLNDGHTSVWFPKDINKILSSGTFEDRRILFKHVDGKAIIAHISIDKKDELPLGTELISVNGIPTQEHLQKNILPYIGASTDHDRMNRAIESNILTNVEGTPYQLRFRLPDGKEKTLNLTLSGIKDQGELYPAVDLQKEMVEFKWLNDGLAYISINTFMNEDKKSVVKEFEKHLPELAKAKKMIIDIRENGGGNSGNAVQIIEYLTNDSILQMSRWGTREHSAAYKSWAFGVTPLGLENNEFYKKVYLVGQDNYFYFAENSTARTNPKKERIVVPTVILIGNNTFSAAEDFLIYADNQKHMIKIGEPTGGSTGNPYAFLLPGKGGARVCTKKDTYGDGRIFVGIGVLPDITVKYTLKDYMDNNDPVLTKAIEYLKGIKNIDEVAALPRASRPYEGIKVPVYWAGTSSYQEYQGIEKTYDNSSRTMYHSHLNNSKENYFPIRIDYSFKGQDKIDYIVYHPRQDGKDSGNFKEVEIWVKTGSDTEFVKLMDYDFKGASTPTKVVLDKSIVNPVTVRFVVKSGTGEGNGFAACSEMEFYRLS